MFIFDEKLEIRYYLNMKRLGVLILLTFFLILSCGTGPAPAEPVPAENTPAVTVGQTPARVSPPPPAEPAAPVPEPPPEPVPEPAPVEEVFDPETITEEVFTATKTDVQALVGELNQIIRARNYNTWITYLSDSYLERISSPEFLNATTEELYKRDLTVASNLGRDPRRVSKKILRTPKDYFDNLVVPSRSNDQVEDIDFVSENRVRAYRVDGRILYELELIGNKWKIIPIEFS